MLCFHFEYFPSDIFLKKLKKKQTNKKKKKRFRKTYGNQINYRTCSYKCTVKQFSSLEITATVLLSTL